MTNQTLRLIGRRCRVVWLLARPAVVVLLGLFAAIGMAQSGRPRDAFLLARVLVAVIGYLVFSVAVNDLADERIDRINLAGDRRRPLLSGAGNHRDLRVVAAVSAGLATVVAATLHWPALLVLGAGLAFSAAYSLGPVRLADRGAVASLSLPAGYVSVPYLLGLLAAKPAVAGRDLLVLGGLYVGFMGRIVLKDFRDVVGDALFGKRTFLVRHGRAATCRFAAGCWVAGSATILAVRGAGWPLAASYGCLLVASLAALRRLARPCPPHRDEALISAIAILGRGLLVLLLAQYSCLDVRWSSTPTALLMAAVTAAVLGQAHTMIRRGPRSGLTVPAVMAARPVSVGASAH